MPEIILVCGAGGKTTYIENLSKSCKNKRDKKVIITTTTKMYKPNEYTDSINSHSFDNKNIIVLGKEYDEKKLMYAGDDELNNAIKYADIILIEADGAKHYPIKIPNENEPVIPDILLGQFLK